jgi:hypothetical protein
MGTGPHRRGTKPLLSVWLLDIGWTAKQACDHLSNFIDSDDKLMVVEFIKQPAFTKAFAGTNDWIKSHAA